MKKIYRYSTGIPRLINIVCDRSLLIGYIEESREISGRMAARAVAEVRLKRTATGISRLAWGAALVTILAVLGVMHFIAQGTPVKVLSPRPTVNADLTPKPYRTAADDMPLIVRKELGGMKETESAVNAFNALAGVWNIPQLPSGSVVHSRREMERLAKKRGLSLAPFNGSLNRLLEADSPALLEFTLSGISGRRYLALIGRENDRFLIAPPLKGRGYLSRADLEGLWSGRAYLPWKNFQNIPRLTPGMSGEAVTRLQQLLHKAGVYKGGLTGIYNRETTAAITAFQAAHGIKRNGRPGKQTLFFLYHTASGFSTPRLEKKGGEQPG